jgi:uncharacterized protein YndB with AHSA1/START domain
MPDIVHHFPIKASADLVFQAISTPAGLDTWWTKRASGEPKEGAEYELWFGSDHDWRAIVSRCAPPTQFELELTSAHEDWQGTRLGFGLEEMDGLTQVRFHHTGWPQLNDHYQVSCYCWAMYLRLLRRYVEMGEIVPYEDRLNA